MPAKTFAKFIERTNAQVRWWSYAAWTLPFVALATLGVSWFFGNETVYEMLLIGIGLTFFAVSVFWWWWALFKLKDIVSGLDKTISSLTEVKEEIILTRKVIEDSSSWEQNDSTG